MLGIAGVMGQCRPVIDAIDGDRQGAMRRQGPQGVIVGEDVAPGFDGGAALVQGVPQAVIDLVGEAAIGIDAQGAVAVKGVGGVTA